MSEVPVRARDYMSSPAITIEEHESVACAQAIMRHLRIRHLPVTRNGALVGLVSERDIFLLLSLSGVQAEQERVEEAMTEMPFTVGPNEPLASVARAMALGKFGSAIVMEEGRVVGIITTVDLMRGLGEHASEHR
jgi:CBS domain-containing protein